MKFHVDGTKPKNNEIFCFGSNLAGVHGAGAALEARIKYGAHWHHGVGPMGESYAIPTKDKNINTMPISSITPYVLEFIQYAKDNPNINFWMTGIGCGLSGYKPKDIAPLFIGSSDNISFPDTWRQYLTA